LTVIVTLRVGLLPPAPVHTSVYVFVLVRLLSVWLPLGCFAPLQPPDAVQAAAFVLFHERVDDPPEVTLVGFALNVSVGAGGVPTLTVTLCICPEPPLPEHCNENVVAAMMLLIVSLPEVGFVPLHPPEAVQLVALLDDQVSCVLPPALTDVGFAESEPVGAGTGVGPGSSCSESSPPQAARASASVASAAKRALRNMANAGTREWKRGMGLSSLSAKR
jgi:hypothetical protein